MAKKINLSGVKEFMFNHGEKVALGTCIFLALLVGGIGIMRATSAGTADGSTNPWEKELKNKHDNIRGQMARIVVEELGPDTKKALDIDRQKVRPIVSTHQQSPYAAFPSIDDLKRHNPIALGINPKNVRLDYVAGLVWVYEKEGANVKELLPPEADGGGPVPMGQPMGQPKTPPMGGAGGAKEQGAYLKAARAERLVVVTATFPMKEQMQEFQTKLKMLSQSSMLEDDQDDLPKPVGMNVIRYEIVNNQRVENSAKIILQWNEKGTPTKAKKLDELLQMAFYDEELPEVLKYWLHECFHTPMPRLANAKYPRFSFKDSVEVVWSDDEKHEGGVVGNPMTPPMPKVGTVPPMPKGSGSGPPPMPKGGGPPPGSGGPPPGSGGGLPGVKDKKPPVGGGGDNTATAVSLPERKEKLVSKKDMLSRDRELHDRLFLNPTKYNIYHILGQFQPTESAPAEKKGFGSFGTNTTTARGEYFSPWHLALPGEPGESTDGAATPPKFGTPPKAGGPPGVVPPKGMPPMPGGTPGPQGTGAVKVWDRDAIVRFVDPDVTPGSTYQYKISVVMKNPNHDKKTLVAFNGLAEVPFLFSKEEFTPTITIPEEHFLYCVDQHQLDEFGKVKDPKEKAPKVDPFLLKPGEITFQIHHWTTTARGEKNSVLSIGDWAIAERVKVRRGDSIGARSLVKVPAWYKHKDGFEVPQHAEQVPGKPKEFVQKPGFYMDFKTDAERPVLVDFAGGKLVKSKDALVDEEVAVDAVIIDPSGRLRVLNSRIDTDTEDPNAMASVKARAHERHERVLHMRERVQDLINPATPAAEEKKGMPPMTKLPGTK